MIAVMNEAFSDLNVLGPLACNERYLGFLYSLADDPGTLEYGYNYVSTRGGGTSTTEFEFLTGDSISNVNYQNPYAMFDFRKVPSLVEQFKKLGYHTIAMHPEYKENWRRSTVYPALGFDECLWLDSFEGYDRTIYDRVSDLGDYQKLIDVYEKTDEPTFILNVTMQNHGSYEQLEALAEEDHVEIDEQYSQYTDAQLYESLIAKADNALEYLISYFRDVEEPVVICFFGDHQPSLNTEFEEELLAEGRKEEDNDLSMWEKRYIVPYFIWSNYDVQDDSALNQANDSELRTENAQNAVRPWVEEPDAGVMSTNYLGSVLLEHLGLPLSPFNRYLLAQRKEIPVLNFGGYRTEDGYWHYLDEDTEYRHWLDDYRLIQYNSLFDKKRDQSLYVSEGSR